MAALLTLSTSLDHKTVAANAGETDLKLQVELTASPELLRVAVAPVRTHLCLAIDGSGSMIGERLRQAMKAARLIVDTLQECHALSVVLFHAGAEVLIDTSSMSEASKDPARQKIQSLAKRLGGSTNLAEGIRQAAALLGRSQADARVLVILTDGEADDPRAAETAAKDASASGCQLHAVGVGGEFDADRLLELVRPSNGSVFGQGDVSKLVSTFSAILNRVDNYVATQARMKLTFAPGAQVGAAYRLSPDRALLGTMATDARRSVSLSIGNIERDKSYTFLFVVTLSAHEARILELAQVQLDYEVPALPSPHQSQTAIVSVVCTPAPRGRRQDPWVARAFAEAQRLEWVDQLSEAARNKDRARAAECLRKLNDEDAGDTGQYRVLLDQLEKSGEISRSALNELVLGSTGTHAISKGAASPAPDAVAARPPPIPKRAAPPTVAPAPPGKPAARPVVTAAERTGKDRSGKHSTVVASAPAAAMPEKTGRERSGKHATVAERETGKYDVVLLDAGEEVIRVVRELRDATRTSLREAADLVKRRNIAVKRATSRASAEKLEKRLTAAGARVEVKPAS